MDIINILFFILSAVHLPIISGAKTSTALKHWKETRTICGYDIKSIPLSIRIELMKFSYENNNANIEEMKLPSDQILINYQDFRCCLKKAWFPDFTIEHIKLKCIKNVVNCFVESEEKPCKLSSDYFIYNASTKVSVLFVFFITSYIVLWTIVFFCRAYVRSAHVEQQRRRERRRSS